MLTVTQTGEIRARPPGKGNNPPEWLGMYLEDMPSRWFEARAGDVVLSSIDLWKGCIAVVPVEFDRAIVTKEFPVYEVIGEDLDAEFLSVLLRSRYYQRAFRAITTGHSNRRRTQEPDFESLEVCYPPDVQEQRRLIANIQQARAGIRTSIGTLHQEMLSFSDLIDGRSEEELPDVEGPESEE